MQRITSKSLITPKSLIVAASLAAAPLAALPVAVPSAIAVELPSFAPLIKEVKPAVVTVLVEGNASDSAATPRMPERFREFFERYGDVLPQRPERGPRPQRGMGSGFIIAADGVIVTNNHVVEGAGEITVVLPGGERLDAELIGRDDRIDIAVLKVESDDPLPTVAWGDSDEIEVGDWAIAIGNPLGLNGTVTAGIVSARGRDINSGPYDDFLQVDAAINRGNSGGPLFDTDGAVIGVNTAIISPSGGNVGLGFAIPANQARGIVEDLLEDGTVERGWIGVAIQNVSPDIAESLGLDGADGVLVADVTPDSPAAAAGLLPGDIILAFAAEDIDEVRDLTTIVADAMVGNDYQISVWRNGSIETLTITPDLLQTASLGTSPRAELPGASSAVPVPELGLALKLDDGKLVIDETIGGVAEAQGLRPGDVILSVNQVTVEIPADVAEVVEAAEAAGRDKVLLLIDREGGKRFVTLDLNAA